MKTIIRCIAVSVALVSLPATAEVVVGVIVGATGPGASHGIPMKNTVAILPDTIGGEKARYVILDDGTDTTNAVKNARKLFTEDKVDVLIGSTSVPTIIAISDVAAEMKTPQIGLSPISGKVAKNPWVFSVSQPTHIMMGAAVDDMVANKTKRVGYIGFSDSWGDQVYAGFADQAKARGIEVSADERYGRTDASVKSQVLKILATHPDAVVIGASGNASALPHLMLVQSGFKGPIYHTHGVITKEFIRIGGKAVEGAIAPTGPVVVAEQLPTQSPTKAVSLEFIKAYEAKYGQGSRNVFAAYTYDAYLLIDSAVPVALKKGKPGTPEFRQALRDAMESTKDLVTTHAVHTMTPDDRTGVDARARVLVSVQDGEWKLKQ